eukprot:jgi/Ulvmu1/2462/UM136_0014.1
MGMPLDVSDFLANLQGDDAKPNEDPDWLNDFDDDEASKQGSERQGSQSSEDPFAFLATPSKITNKASQEASTPVTAIPAGPVNHQADTTPTPTPKQRPKPKTGGVVAGVDAPGRVTIKNPDKIVFNRLLVEVPHKETDAVDLSGDTGAVGRFSLVERLRMQQRKDVPLNSDAEASEQPEEEEAGAAAPHSAGKAAEAVASDDAAGSPAGEPAGEKDGRHNGGEEETVQGLVLDLKGVRFDAAIASLAGTACVVNIGPSGAKVEAVFNEFVQLDESSLFEDYEEVTAGTIDGWGLADLEDAGAGDGTGTLGKKQKAPTISSGRVVKASKRKAPSKGGKPKAPRKSGTRKR